MQKQKDKKKSASLSLRIDPELKEQMNKELSGLGIDAAAYLTMSIKQLVKQHRIPFEVTNMTQLDRRIQDSLDSGIGHTITTDEEANAYLAEMRKANEND